MITLLSHPLVILALAVSLFTGGAGVGGWAAHKMTAESYEADLLKVQAAAQAKYAAEVTAYQDVSTKYEAAKNDRQTVTKIVNRSFDRIVDRPVYRDHDCVDDDGLRIINAALDGSSASASQLDAAMQALDAANRKVGSSAGAKDH